MPSISDKYELVSAMFQALTWVAVIVAAYLVLEALNGGGDDPDGFA